MAGKNLPAVGRQAFKPATKLPVNILSAFYTLLNLIRSISEKRYLNYITAFLGEGGGVLFDGAVSRCEIEILSMTKLKAG
jgi:hypothetical protein